MEITFAWPCPPSESCSVRSQCSITSAPPELAAWDLSVAKGRAVLVLMVLVPAGFLPANAGLLAVITVPFHSLADVSTAVPASGVNRIICSGVILKEADKNLS